MDAAQNDCRVREDGLAFSPVCVIPAQSFSKTYPIAKRFIDFAMSALGLVFLSPLMLVVAALIRFTSKGPAIYKQVRVGRDGRRFYIYKFRTMVDGADNLKRHLSPEQQKFYRKNRKLIRDPRVTRLGAKLRAGSLDELPQLINVLKGDMSLVGPRPMLPEEVEQYGAEYSEYIQMCPGITGLWQIRHRHETQMHIRAQIDSQYYATRCLQADAAILFATVKTVLGRKGAC